MKRYRRYIYQKYNKIFKRKERLLDNWRLSRANADIIGDQYVNCALLRFNK